MFANKAPSLGKKPRTTKGDLILVFSIGLQLTLLSACTPPNQSNEQQVQQNQPIEEPLSILRMEIPPVATPQLPKKIPDRMKTQFERSPENAAKQMLTLFDKMEKNGAVNHQNITNHIKAGNAQKRANILTRFFSADLNGDGNLTSDERQFAKSNNKNALRFYSANLRAAKIDIDGDDIWSLQEMILYVQFQKKNHNGYYSDQSYFHLFDQDNDGTTTREEMVEILAEFLPVSKLEQNLNSTTRNNSKSKTPKTSGAQILKRGCKMPKPNADDTIIVLGAGRGELYSSLDVSGADIVTTVGRINIEPGKDELYIVAAASRPMVWVLEGDVKRVNNFIAQNTRHQKEAGVGVTGIDKNKVHFIEQNCFPFFTKLGGKEELILKAKADKLLGRKPDGVYATQSFPALNLPSGQFTKNFTNRLNMTRCRFEKTCVYAPDKVGKFPVNKGVVFMGGDDVHASLNIKVYEVLPGQAGLDELIEQGKIKRLTDGTLHIVKPIPRFPFGLSNFGRVSYILSKDVPMPDGRPRSTQVFSEETGDPIPF